jgi:hypothetical protein
MKIKLQLLSLIILLFACGETPDLGNSILDTNIGAAVPEATITVISEVYHDNSVTIIWDGDEFVNAFRYRLEPINQTETVNTYSEWSDWGRDTTSVTLKYLDEGHYNFHVEGRFNMDHVGSASAEFEVDAIDGESLRMFPLQQFVKVDSMFNVYLFSEEVGDLVGMQVQLNYDSSVLEYQNWEKGATIVNHSDYTIVPAPEISDGSILFTGVVSGSGLPQTSELLKLTFKYLGSADQGSTEITIDLSDCDDGNSNGENCNTQLRDNLNEPIEILIGSEGLIKEVQ